MNGAAATAAQAASLEEWRHLTERQPGWNCWWHGLQPYTPEGVCNDDACEGHNGESVCALIGCAKTGKMMVCSGCAPRRWVFYHDQQCQAAHWEKKHRLDCFHAPNLEQVPPPAPPALAPDSDSTDVEDYRNDYDC
jgi:hypothetical protein